MNKNFSNNVIFYIMNKNSWEFCGNGIIINKNFIATASHIFEDNKTYAISSIKDLEKKILFHNDDFKYNTLKNGKNQTEIDLAIIYNKWFIAENEIEFEEKISIGEQINIYGFNKENDMPIQFITINTIAASGQLDNMWGCMYHEDMTPGISGSPVFNKNKKLLGIFISILKKHSLGIFVKSEFIKSTLK